MWGIVRLSFKYCFWYVQALSTTDHKFQYTSLFLHRVRNLYQMFKTVLGQCRIYAHIKCSFKMYH